VHSPSDQIVSGLAHSVALVAIALVLPVSTLRAQEGESHLYDKLEVSVSATDVILNTDIRIDGSGGKVGTDLDAEDDLGLAKSSFQPRAAVRWRPGRRHELEAGIQFASRDANRTLSRDISFGDTTFAAGATVHSQFSSDLAFLTYRFAIFAHETWQAGVGLGVGALFFSPKIEALGSGGSQSVQYSQSKSATGPIGSLGVYGRYTLSPRWYLEADVRGVRASVDRFTASVVEGGGAVRYFFAKKWGVEGGYGISAIQVDVGPKTGGGGLASGKIKYSLQNIRLGVLFHP